MCKDVTSAYLIAADMEEALARIPHAPKVLMLISMAKGLDEEIIGAVQGLTSIIATSSDDAGRMAENIARKALAATAIHLPP